MLLINDCVLTGGKSERGAALYLLSGQTVVNNSTISNNTARLHGGAIFISNAINFPAAEVYINNSSLIGNRVTDAASNSGGGAIFNQGGAQLTITNSTISDNLVNRESTLPGIGGGIFAFQRTHLFNVTIANNYAHMGGGVYSQAALFTGINSIIADNSGTNNLDFFGTFTSDGYNLLETLPTQNADLRESDGQYLRARLATGYARRQWRQDSDARFEPK